MRMNNTNSNSKCKLNKNDTAKSPSSNASPYIPFFHYVKRWCYTRDLNVFFICHNIVQFVLKDKRYILVYYIYYIY
jgi:hypothetical protein